MAYLRGLQKTMPKKDKNRTVRSGKASSIVRDSDEEALTDVGVPLSPQVTVRELSEVTPKRAKKPETISDVNIVSEVNVNRDVKCSVMVYKI